MISKYLKAQEKLPQGQETLQGNRVLLEDLKNRQILSKYAHIL